MRVGDYVKLNVRHYGGKMLEAADSCFISLFAEMQFRRMQVPSWSDAHAARIRAGDSYISRLMRICPDTGLDADRILQGQIRLFGQQIMGEAGCPDWSKDYVSGHRFPVQPYGRYQIRNDSGADIIVPWELSRLQFVPALIGAHLLRPDARHGQHFFRVVEHWMAANPYLQGVNWMCGLDVAIRAANLALGIVHFEQSDPARVIPMKRLLWAHLVYLQERDLYLRKSVVNNHQLVAAVLHFALLHLFDSGDVTKWRKQAWAIVAHEVPRQFRPDGGNFESAWLYHQFVLESLYVAIGLLAPRTIEDCFGGQNGLPAVVCDRIQAATRFVAHYAQAWSGVPQVGDSSDGRILFHRDYFSWTPADCSYLADWAAVVFPNDDPFVGNARSIPRAVLYAESGVGLFNGPRYSVLCLAMPVDKGAAGHNHLDKASLLLRIGDSPVFVDSGTYCYTPDLAARKELRAGRAHNVMLIVGEDQASFSGPGAFEVPELNDVGIRLSGDADAGVSFAMWHDGYRRIAGVGQVSRCVICGAHGVTLEDSIAGAGEFAVELVFNLHPGLRFREAGGQLLICADDDHLCTLVPPAGWSVRLEAAWQSSGYGERRASQRVLFSATVVLPLNVTTEIHLP